VREEAVIISNRQTNVARTILMVRLLYSFNADQVGQKEGAAILDG
jgi:hypothetical protein